MRTKDLALQDSGCILTRMGTHYCVDGTPFLVDDEDDDHVSAIRWYAHRTPRSTYVYDRGGVGLLHRWLTGAQKGVDVDHVNSSGLDNRKANLRPATRSQNACNSRKSRANSSGEKGVSWHKAAGKWMSYVGLGGKRYYLGLYDTLEEAAEVVRAERARLCGEYVNHG